MGFAGIVGSFFFENNMNGELYLWILQTRLIRKFGKLKNSNEHIFMQDGAPPDWSTNVRKWLVERKSPRTLDWNRTTASPGLLDLQPWHC